MTPSRANENKIRKESIPHKILFMGNFAILDYFVCTIWAPQTGFLVSVFNGK